MSVDPSSLLYHRCVVVTVLTHPESILSGAHNGSVKMGILTPLLPKIENKHYQVSVPEKRM